MIATRQRYDDYDDAVEDYFDPGWTDGLPIVPPRSSSWNTFSSRAGATRAMSSAMYRRDLVVTVEHVAINAVMAGCRPEYMPVVLAAVRAQLREGRRGNGSRCRIGRPEGLRLVVAGGRGGALTTVLTPHVGLAVTEPIDPT